MLVEDVLDRLGRAPVGDLPRQVAEVAAPHVADDHACDPVELPRVAELGQLAVDEVRRRVGVLEEEDRALGLELPRRPEGLQQEPEAAADERPARLAGCDRADVRVIWVARDIADDVAAQHTQQPLAGERGRLLVADTDQAVAVEGRKAGALADRDVQGRDVAVADERLRVRGEQVEVEVGEHSLDPNPPCSDWTTSTSGSANSACRSSARRFGVAGDVVVAVVDAGPELDAVALRLPPLDAAVELRAHVVRARACGNADRPAVGKGLHEVQPKGVRHRTLGV